MQLVASVVALALAAQAYATPSGPIKYTKEPSYFTSAFHTRAVNTTIVANDGSRPAGQAGAFGQYALRINSDKNVICWDITLVGVTGEYQSPAVTATHLHQAPAGSAGPPRIAFPNPTFTGNNPMGAEIRRSSGCQKAPFVTGVDAPTGGDTGSASGFTLRQVEENPAGFFADTHTQAFTAGAVRGQLNPSELEVKRPKYFTSTLRTVATGDQVISGVTQEPVDGAKNGKGYYELKINTDKNVLCYDIVLAGDDISTRYTSPAKTATHTHQAVKGKNGPPRLAYKNPQKSHSKWSKWVHKASGGRWGKSSKKRQSKACIKGPFTTGLIDPMTGQDSGSASGFTLSALQSNPSGFFSDVHTFEFTQGAVRGQMYNA